MAKKLSGEAPVVVKQGIAWMSDIQAKITFGKSATATEPTQGVEKTPIGSGSDDVAAWGDNNDLPNKWELEVENDNTLTDAIEKSCDFLYGVGLECGYEIVENNQRVFVPQVTTETEDFFEHPMTIFAFGQMIRDYKIHGLPVPELVISDGMMMVNALPAAHFRWAKQAQNGWINFGYFNRNWTNGAKATSDTTKKIAVYDPMIDTIEGVKASTLTNMVYRVPIPTHRTYYPLPPVYSAKTSKWLDIKLKLTESFFFSLENQMSPKYHIEVDEKYMATKYGKRWARADEKEIEAIMLEELAHFHKMLHGTNNTGKNVITTKRIENLIKKEYSSWTFNKLDGTVYESGHLELMREAESQIRQSGGIDKTLQGAGQGSGMGAGSGSDKREAFNIKMATAMRHLKPMLQVFELALAYNNMKGPKGEKLKVRVVTPFLQTQNNVTPSKRETTVQP